MSRRAPLNRRLEIAPPPSAPELADQAARREFVRMLSHELRTPLNSIIGFSEILNDELFGPLGAPEYKDYAAFIHASGQRMLRLVNQVVEIARLQSGAEDLHLQAAPLDSLFDDAARTVAPDLAARNLSLTIRLPRPPPSALIDSRAVRTAMVNLLQNAATFAPEGGEVRLIGRVKGPLIQIDVSDDGEGLDPAKVERLMRPFEQGEHTLVRRTDGAGLGWAIVTALTNAMGGRFEVETAPGQGLTATLSFRRAG